MCVVVDDDSRFRESIASALSDRSYDVIGYAGSAAEARDGVSRPRPDAILLDVCLPDGDGISLARELISGDGTVRVLLTSSDSAVAPARLVRGSGATGFIAKDELLASDLSRYLG